MLRSLHFILLVSLMVDGGTVAPQPDALAPGSDGGTVAPQPDALAPGSDGGTVAPQPDTLAPGSDGGTVAPSPITVDSIRWPKDLQPLARLDGPAVLAAHAALQHVLSRFPEEYARGCTGSARALDVVVGQDGGLYFVQIFRRADRCGWAPGTVLEFDWFELYAVSSDGRVLVRYPYMP
jgi:hypothetical protein